MAKKLTYEELEQKIIQLKNKGVKQERAEKALRETDEKYRSLVEATSDWIWEVDHEGVYTYTNSKVKEILGYEPEEIIGKTPFDFMLPDEQKRLSEWFRDILVSRKPFEGIENTNIHKDGGHILLETSGVPIFDIDGNLSGYRGIDRNIARRKLAEVALQKAHIELERRVEERTAELKSANEKLKQEIEEHKQAREALRESESLHRLHFENVSDVIYSVDPELKITNISSSVERVLGYKPEELIGRSFQELNLLAPEYLEQAASDTMHVLGGERITSAVYQFIARDGIKKWGDVSGAPLIRDGQIVALISVARDITERKQAEEALQESEERYRSLFEQSNDAIIIHELSGQILEVNQRTYEMLGYDQEQFHRMTIPMLHPRIEFGASVKAFQETRSQGYTLFESQFERADGTPIDVEISSSIIDKANGIVQGIIRDITERKQAEVLMSKSNALLTSVINQAPFAIHILEGEFSNINVVIENAESARIMGEVVEGRTGIDADTPEMLTTRFFSIDGKQEIPLSRMPGPRAFRGEVVTNEEFIFQHSNGTQIMVEAGASPVYDANNQIIAVAVVFQDITKRKKAEKEREQLTNQLTQSQKMEAVGTLAGGIAHDFNNILGAVILLSELSLLETHESSSLHRHIEKILEAGMRAKDLVKQILAFSRKRDQERIPMSITPIINEALKLLRSSLPSTIKINHHMKKDLGLIQGDPTQIHQVVMNLCTNAEHAMREKGGVLDVKLERVDVDDKMAALHHNLHPGPHVRFEVADPGKGMDPATMGSIFDPYFTTKSVGEGTGLGLAVVRGIVHKHGGAIIAESEPGKGTTFQVFFPVIEGKKEETGEKSEAPLPTGTEHILFIDDEKVLAKVAKYILELLGYKVTIKTNSTEALELFKLEPDFFDLVITDMSMPNITGEQLSREVMKIRPELPIIMCTGFSHIISKEKAHEIGIKAFVMKPLARKDLADMVRRVLDEK